LQKVVLCFIVDYIIFVDIVEPIVIVNVKNLKCYDKSLEIEPGDANIWNSKADVFVKLGKYKEAIECHDKSLEIESGDANIWNSKGNSHLSSKEYDEALKCFDHKFVYALGNKAVSLFYLQKYDEALNYCNKALD
jgi:tetratricopeptide (TPR) repeat protein